MGKKILIAFDESENSMRAVDFIGGNFGSDSAVTIFNVLMDTESICAMQGPELVPYFKSQQSAFCSLEDKKKEVLGQAMEKARQKLVQNGFDGQKVSTKSVNREKGIARDIVREIQNGGYDLVVLCKTGQSGIKEFILGGISQKVIHNAANVSVLLVE